MTAQIDQQTLGTLKIFVERVGRKHAVLRAYLYGSRARGDHAIDSDADLALIMECPADANRTFAIALGALEFDVMLETGLLVSALPISEQDWENPERSINPALIDTIKREGIAL